MVVKVSYENQKTQVDKYNIYHPLNPTSVT